MRSKDELLLDFAKWQTEAGVNLVSINRAGRVINPWDEVDTEEILDEWCKKAESFFYHHSVELYRDFSGEFFGYSEDEVTRMRLLADFQSELGIYDVSVVSEELGVSVNNPWYDSTGRFPLGYRESLREYGEALVGEWCKRASEYLKDHSIK